MPYRLHIVVAAITLGSMVAFSVRGRGIFRLFCTLNGLIVGWAVAFALGVVPEKELAHIAQVPWVALPDPSFPFYSFEFPLIPRS